MIMWIVHLEKIKKYKKISKFMKELILVYKEMCYYSSMGIGKKMIIYKITNKTNGKVYIGKTKRTLEKRWKQHCNNANVPFKRFKLHEDILKYGSDVFIVEQIDEAFTVEDANNKEVYWIGYYNSRFPNGYNVSKGGNNGGNERKVMNTTTGETFDTITEAAKVYNRKNEAIRQVLDKPHRTCANCHWISL